MVQTSLVASLCTFSCIAIDIDVLTVERDDIRGYPLVILYTGNDVVRQTAFGQTAIGQILLDKRFLDKRLLDKLSDRGFWTNVFLDKRSLDKFIIIRPNSIRNVDERFYLMKPINNNMF